MIKRINLIEKKAFALTYLKLVRICLIVVAINMLFIGYQYFNSYRLKNNIKTANSEIKKLESKRDALMKQPVRKKVSVGQYQELFDKIENTPAWSRLLYELSEKMPNTVWITNFKSVSSSSGPQITTKESKSHRDKKNKKAKQKQQSVKKHLLEVYGMGSNMRNVTEFATKLSQSSFFENLVLSEAKEQTYGIAFKIRSEINKDVR